jgi:hypothetical protein
MIKNNNKIPIVVAIMVFTFFVATSAKAQVRPGNTSLDVALWLKADTLVGATAPADGSDVTTLPDASGHGRIHNRNGTDPVPKFNSTTKVMNYQPSLKFSATAGERLVGIQTLGLNSSHAYHIFYVSEVETNTADVRSVFSPMVYNADNGNYLVGWQNGTIAFYRATLNSNGVPNGITLATPPYPSTGKLYGVNLVTRPNSSGEPTRAYFNGVVNPAAYAGNSLIDMARNQSVSSVGTRLNTNTATASFIGNIQEIIVLSSPSGAFMPGLDLTKVYSYLSLKYGITYEGNDYLNSTGTAVWSRSANNGFNKNIFGIVRDDLSGLYQKQATSYESSFCTVFLNPVATPTASPPALNKLNTAVIADDKTYILFGSNGLRGYIDYDPAAAGYPSLFPERVNLRTKEILKVQMRDFAGTIASYTVNIKPSNGEKYVLVSQNSNFPFGATQVHQVNSNGFVTVTLNNGDYISLVNPFRVSPGGTGIEAEVWLKADNFSPFPAAGANVTTWADASGKGRNYSQDAAIAVPTFRRTAADNLMNFQPYLNFGTDVSRLIGPSNIISATKSYHLFYVSRQSASTTTMATVYTPGSNGTIYANNSGWYGGHPYLNTGAVTRRDHPGNGKLYGITSVFRPNTTSDLQHLYMNGVQNTVAIPGATLLTSTNSGGRSTVGTHSNNAEGFVGAIEEIILISDLAGHNPVEADARKIRSYLALKYGITLENNYIDSKERVIWDRTSSQAYHKAVFGIGKDESSGFYQKQAKSYEDSTLTVYVGNQLYTLNMENTADPLADGVYAVFGNNQLEGWANYNIAASTTYANPTLTTIPYRFDYRLNKTLKVQLTGVPSLLVNVKVENNEADYLLVSSSTAFNPAFTYAYPIPANRIVTGVEIQNESYIGFGIQAIPQTTNYSVDFWLVADSVAGSHNANIATWPSVIKAGTSMGGTMTTTVSVARQPKINTQNYLLNYHKALYFGQSWMTGGSYISTGNIKSYYTFSVTRDRDTASTAINNPHVFLSLNANRGNYDGWFKKMPSFSTRTSDVAGQNQFYKATTLDRYGIIGVIRPNSLSIPQTIYFNGAMQRKSAAQTYGETGNFIVGSRSADYGSGSWPFIGDIYEVMVLSATGNATIDMIEAQKIQSYLAFKYGITLDLGDYLDNNGQPFWSRANAIDSYGTKYENFIFGIGKNTTMGVDQKQAFASQRTAKSPFEIYVGTKGALNSDNSTSLTDNTFLMLSADAYVNGLRSLPEPVPANTEYLNPAGGTIILPALKDYTSAVFKVQTVNQTNWTVNIQNLIESKETCYLRVSTNPLFDPSQTYLYEFDASKTATNVLLKAGDFLSVLAKDDPAPGGVVEGLRMWLKSDAGPAYLEVDAGKVNKWKDFSSAGALYERFDANAANRPSFTEIDPKMNYHPAVVFQGKSGNPDQHLISQQAPMKAQSPNEYTFFTLLNNRFDPNTNTYIMGFGTTTNAADVTTRHPAFGMESRSNGTQGLVRFFEDGGSGLIDGTENLFIPGSTTIVSHQVKKNEYLRFEIDGKFEEKPQSSIGNGTIMNNKSTLSAGSIGSRSMTGSMAEIFAYERLLDDREKDIIYSYLGLKYGITIDVDQNDDAVSFDYFLSDQTTVWAGNSDINGPYHHWVAGLVRDDAAMFENKQSRSTAVGAQLWMGLGHTDATGTYILDSFDKDKSAIVSGSNTSEGVITFSAGDEVCGIMDSRMKKVWLMDNSAWDYENPLDPNSEHVLAPQTITLRIGDAGGFPYQGSGYQVYMLVADSPEDLDEGDDGVGVINNWKQKIVGTYVNGAHQFEYTFNRKYTYFTFSGKFVGGACEPCAGGPKSLNFNSAIWPMTGDPFEKTINVDTGFDVNIKVDFAGSGGVARYSTSYPRTVSNSLNIRRRYNGGNWLRTYIHPTTPAAASFEIYHIDRVATNRYAEVQVVGLCNGDSIYPRLSYSTTALLSSYIIGNKGMASAKRTPISNYSASAGRMWVNFDQAVDSIVVSHRQTGTVTGTADAEFGIGPITFTCPLPPPPVNEAGLAFTKEGPTQLSLCDKVIYTYRIYNANCGERLIDVLSDELPVGMSWVPNSLSADEEDLRIANVNDYGGVGQERILRIENLFISGADEEDGITIIRATAKFDKTTIAGTYGSYAQIEYNYILEDVEKSGSLLSCDRYKGCGVPTEVTATGSPGDRIEPLETDLDINRSCYRANQEIVYTLNVINKDTRILNGIALDLTFNEAPFTLTVAPVAATSTGAPLTLGTPPVIDGNSYTYNNVTIPPGEHTITFRLKAPVKGSLPIEYIDDYGNEVYSPVWVRYMFSTSSSDPCMINALDGADGMSELQYCTSLTKILTNKNVTNRMKKE